MRFISLETIHIADAVRPTDQESTDQESGESGRQLPHSGDQMPTDKIEELRISEQTMQCVRDLVVEVGPNVVKVCHH